MLDQPQSIIRPAQPSDAPRMLQMGLAQFVEAGWGDHAEFCQFDAHSFLNKLQRIADGGLMFVADQAGTAVGMVAAEVGPAYWNESILLFQEVFWYCEPEYRKGTGTALLRELEHAAKAVGVRLGVMASEDGVRGPALARLYRGAGYNPIERLFVKVL